VKCTIPNEVWLLCVVQVKQEQPESALAAAAAADGMQIDGAAGEQQQQQQDLKPPPEGVQEVGECLYFLIPAVASQLWARQSSPETCPIRRLVRIPSPPHLCELVFAVIP
jgi:hypothetical protein